MNRFSSERWPQIARLLEVILILGWTLYVGKDYLDLDARVWPHGGDYPLTIQAFYQWPLAFECGGCVFWNGSINGGVPAFADSFSGFLHPLPALATLFLGVINGSKLTLLASIFLAGLAQWWIGRILGFGLLTRLWTAGVAVSAGHLSGRMEIGLLGMVMSTAFGSLALAAGIRLVQRGDSRSIALLAAALALTLLAGQGYIQVALALTLSVMSLAFVLRNRTQLGRKFLLAVGLALLISAVFWVPFLRFWPEFGKPIDTSYSASQPAEYIPFNFVIRDPDYYRGDALGRILFPAIYMNYIGWLPVLLSLYALPAVWKRSRRLFLALVGSVFVIFAASGARMVEFLSGFLPDLMAGLRYPPMQLGLAVPLILTMSGFGLERLLGHPWPKVKLLESRVQAKISTPTLVVLLGWSLSSTFAFSQSWYTPFWPPEETLALPQILAAESALWVQPPNEHYWVPDLLRVRAKVTGVFRPWWFRGRTNPAPTLQAVHESDRPAELEPVDRLGSVSILAFPDNLYASMETSSGTLPCQAKALGGNIDVSCTSPSGGVLTVMENAWEGWTVEVDGVERELHGGNWLRTDVSPGQHVMAFRYRPWDVYVGMGLSALGLLLLAWVWLRLPDSY